MEPEGAAGLKTGGGRGAAPSRASFAQRGSPLKGGGIGWTVRFRTRRLSCQRVQALERWPAAESRVADEQRAFETPGRRGRTLHVSWTERPPPWEVTYVSRGPRL